MENRILKCRCATIDGRLGEIDYNSKQIVEVIKDSIQEDVDILTFSEMSIVGYSCGDVLFNQYLYGDINQALEKIVESSKGSNVFIVVGSPIQVKKKIYDCAVVIQNGVIVGVVPKVILDDVNGRESRWIAVPKVNKMDMVDILGYSIPFSATIMFVDKNSNIRIGITLGQDFEYPISVGSILAQNGADIIINPSVAKETVNYVQYVQSMVKASSAQKKCAYLYVSSGRLESTTDCVYSDYMAICENGETLTENMDLCVAEKYIEAFVNLDSVQQAQMKNSKAVDFFTNEELLSVEITLSSKSSEKNLHISKEPFLGGEDVDVVCQRVVEIQSAALLQKIKYSGRNKLVIGISGGLDSTVAVLACCLAFEKAGYPLENIIGVTMPGPGTTDRTYRNSCELMHALGITERTIDINDSVARHLKNIGHKDDLFDITYEQTQSRERTKILMDLANQENAIVIGTGDLSEFALGWMSYSGDQMSMYGLNSGVPKTMIKHLAEYYIKNSVGKLKLVLQDIVETPVSPELLPVDNDGMQKQKTEELVGPYIVHDFYLYYFVKYGYSPHKILKLAECVFSEEYEAKQLKKWMKTFVTRFYTRQFKRTSFPDG